MSQQRIVIEGVRNPAKLPGLAAIEGAELVFTKGPEQLEAALPGVEVILGFGYRDRALEQAWHRADSLQWIHWCAAGVDTLLFPELVDSPVVVTNAAGIFDGDIAEWVVGMAIAMSKDFPRAWRAQDSREWKFFAGTRLAGTRAVIVGAGRIGRAIARALSGLGVSVTMLATSTRPDNEFGTIHEFLPDHASLRQADWVITALPNTAASRELVGRNTFDVMPAHARFMNVGRGDSVVESDLRDALNDGSIAGAALDVVQQEPLDEKSPWWGTKNLVLTPHNSGDVDDSLDLMVDLFLDNLERYRDGLPLRNVVDKQRGY